MSGNRSLSVQYPTCQEVSTSNEAGQGETSAEPPESTVQHPPRRRRLSITTRDQRSIWAHLYGAIMDSADKAQRENGADMLRYRTISHISGRDYQQLSRHTKPKVEVDEGEAIATHVQEGDRLPSEATQGFPGQFGDEVESGLYMAPCEHHPAKCERRYLINDSIPKISTELSKVEFGIRAYDFTPLAFKTVPNRLLADRECSILSQLRKLPNVLHLKDSFINDAGERVLVLPVVKKIHIFHQDLIEIQRIIRQLLTALTGIHSKSIVHLDVNPANLMCDADDNLVLIDFGLASECSQSGCLPACGTPGFVAPEILRESGTSAKADMYSVGIVLGMMLEDYFPSVDLQYLGGSMVRASTTDQIVTQLEDILSLRPDRVHSSYYSDLSATGWDYCSHSPPAHRLGSGIPTIIYDAADLLRSLLQAEPEHRISSTDALVHPFIQAQPSEFVDTEYYGFIKKWGTFFDDELRARTPPMEPYDAYLTGGDYYDDYVIYY
ncbi:hypothetical protein IWQ62_000034 [Dispira parvispora]|uniref:Protein kinase domain-containing protein n=1 Tax=Dispira parvispora TaxID=1520584 RepID=A0A9W8EAL5_9FUNG|nr:hypothetical protein IWQ62_000034 [Dispira parvispora]